MVECERGHDIAYDMHMQLNCGNAPAAWSPSKPLLWGSRRHLAPIALTTNLDFDVPRLERFGRGVRCANGYGRRWQALDASAICAHEVRVLRPVMLRARRLEAPDMIAQVRTTSKVDPHEIEQVAVEGRAVPGLACELIGDVIVAYG